MTLRAITQAYPFLSEPNVHLANLELQRLATGDLGELAYVEGLCGQALTRGPANGTARTMLGR